MGALWKAAGHELSTGSSFPAPATGSGPQACARRCLRRPADGDARAKGATPRAAKCASKPRTRQRRRLRCRGQWATIFGAIRP